MFIFILRKRHWWPKSHLYYVPYSLFLLNIKCQDLVQFLCRELWMRLSPTINLVNEAFRAFSGSFPSSVSWTLNLGCYSFYNSDIRCSVDLCQFIERKYLKVLLKLETPSQLLPLGLLLEADISCQNEGRVVLKKVPKLRSLSLIFKARF